jgi:uncharacterized membrane protein YgdD (TMEM256/DUF423 family)
MERTWIGLAGVFGAAAVAMAAVAAHALGDLAPLALRQVQAALQIQGWHALALFGCGLWARRGGWLADAAGFAFAIGLVLFCGAVYLVALAGASLPGVAPAGGILLIAAWLLLAASAIFRH